jgi:hypothetical protein
LCLVYNLPALPSDRNKYDWLVSSLKILSVVVITIWLIDILPYILLFFLIIALILTPTLQSLRSELNQTIEIDPNQMLDITPWHQKLIKKINSWRG